MPGRGHDQPAKTVTAHGRYLAIGIEVADPVSGAAQHRYYPCQIERLA